MKLDQRIGDGEAKPRPLHAVGHDGASLLKRPAEPRNVLGGDARAIVLNGEMDPLGERG